MAILHQGCKVGEIYRSILSLSFAAPISHCAVSAESADLISRILVADPRRELRPAQRQRAHDSPCHCVRQHAHDSPCHNLFVHPD